MKQEPMLLMNSARRVHSVLRPRSGRVPRSIQGALLSRTIVILVALLRIAVATAGTDNLSGPGLDYSSWNGAVLVGPSGGIFGVRIGYMSGGSVVTGPSFYAQVKQTGDYDPRGLYACVGTNRVNIEWRRDGSNLYGVVTASVPTTVIVECYPALDDQGPSNGLSYVPFHNPAQFRRTSALRAEGWSPRVTVVPGTTRVTGGIARVTDRREIVAPGVSDYFGLELNGDLRSLPSDAKERLSDAFAPPAGLPGGRAYFLVEAKPGAPVCFKASVGGAPVFTAAKFIDRNIIQFVTAGKAASEQGRILGRGPLACYARPMVDALSWMRTFHPFERKIVLPAGRPWLNDGRFNCWGWDESFNAVVMAVEDPEVAENNVTWALGDERMGPVACWIAYCWGGDRQLLRRAYPVYRRIYPPEDASLVRGDSRPGAGNNANVGKGMDDTPMREKPRHLGEMFSLDMSCMKAWNIEVMKAMAGSLGLVADTEHYGQSLAALRHQINETFWDARAGMYRNRYLSGRWSVTESPTSFYPWLAGCPDARQSAAMLKNLTDPGKFWGTYILPSLSREDPEYGHPSVEKHQGRSYPPFCYWRGAIWPPQNYLVYEGLKRYGLDHPAAALALKSVRLWGKAWEAKGWTCENYDPETGEGTPMAQTHQSWSMLLPLLGVEELMGLEWWNSPVALHFGTLAGGTHLLKNVSFHHHRFAVEQSSSCLRVTIDQHEFLSITGDQVVVRNVRRIGTQVQFEFTCRQDVRVTVGGGADRDYAAGEHIVTAPAPAMFPM